MLHPEERIGLALVVILLGVASASTVTFAPSDQGPFPMNASISQPICIEVSGNLSAGIFFTNTTTIGVQYPITDTKALNNATGNYWGPSYGTVYNVTACSGNTVNVSVYQSACDDLRNTTLGAYMNVSYVAGQGGVFFANGTTPTAPNTPSESDTTDLEVDEFVMIGERIWPGGQPDIYLRYWIDPAPDNVPTGIYNTTYLIRGVEIGTDPGPGAC